MADWSVLDGCFVDTLTYDDTNSLPGSTTVDAGANHTKGSWAELVSSTVRQYQGLIITIARTYSSEAENVMIDLAIGGAGSEVAIIENITFSIGENACTSFYIPLEIPVGSRISGRGQTSDTTNRAIDVGIIGVASNFYSQSYQYAETIGANESTTEGIGLVVNGTAHTKGSYSEVASAIAKDFKYLLIDLHWSREFTTADRVFLIDIAIGSAGSEQIIISNLWAKSTAGESVYPAVVGFPVQIPAGSRISVRAQQSAIGAAYTIHLTLHGFS
jgi:hypothetical protein